MSSALREAIYASRDWQAQLASYGAHLKVHAERSHEVAERALDLAAAFEVAEPNRVAAVEMYLLAWKAAHEHPQALVRAQQLCLELGELPTAAKISRLVFQQTENAEYLLAEGLAWIDAGEHDRALPVLMAAEKRLQGDERATVALATARQEWPDFRAEVVRLERAAAAADTPAEAAEKLLNAARILRILGTEGDEYGRLLSRAFDAHPTDEQVFSLFENWLVQSADVDRLTQMYRRRSSSATTEYDAVELLRRAGTKLALKQVQVGLGMQLLKASLSRAYRANLNDIPGHLAMVVLVRQFSETAGLEREFLSIVAEGTGTAVPVEHGVALAITGLDVAWTRLRDPELAHPYASLVASAAPEHPILVAYHAEGGMAHGQHLVGGAPHPESGDNPCSPLDLPAPEQPYHSLPTRELVPGAAEVFAPPPVVIQPAPAPVMRPEPAPLPMAARATILPARKRAPTPAAPSYDNLPAAHAMVSQDATASAAQIMMMGNAPTPGPLPAPTNTVLGFELGPAGGNFKVAPSSLDVIDEDVELGPAGTRDERLMADEFGEGTEPVAMAPSTIDDLEEPMEIDPDEVELIDDEPKKKARFDIQTPDPESMLSNPGDKMSLLPPKPLPETASFILGGKPAPAPGRTQPSDSGWMMEDMDEAAAPEPVVAVETGPTTRLPIKPKQEAEPIKVEAKSEPEKVEARLAKVEVKKAPVKVEAKPAKVEAKKAPEKVEAKKAPEKVEARPAKVEAKKEIKAPPAVKPVAAPRAPGAGPGLNLGSLIPKAALSALKTVQTKPEAPKPQGMPEGGQERAQRLPIPADVRIRCAGADAASELSMVTRDISETGMFILAGESLAVGTAVEVKISLPSLDDWATTECQLRGAVVRHDSEKGFGINFENPSQEFIDRVRELIVSEP